MALPCTSMSLVRCREHLLSLQLRCRGLRQRIVQADPETTIACWCTPSDLEDPQKPALLLIHGFGGSSTWQWGKQIKSLRKHFRLFLPDLVFFGKSFTVSQHRSEIFQAEMIASAMEAMGIKSYNVLGISYGGFVAFRLAHIFQERVEKVVIVSSGICMSPRDMEELLARGNVKKVPELFVPETHAAVKDLLRLSFVKPPPLLCSFIIDDVIQNMYGTHRKELKELLEALQKREDEEALPTLPQVSYKTISESLVWLNAAGYLQGLNLLSLHERLKL
ncbi:hypothetical protein KP509_05G032900 [Ceratopteris richardii]|uniref:AB hydrolase-1 domain-containing protein n=1 Tax=Ceratopteris richardii TaxID=49495 RepID=A0A8T2UPN5_CERRI|nr:hypothetical protein KP509_05G032900 [Ceratopteris richardii]KAH7436728.1 hypothetical protein KP509_05G032900 [Ceratopteris richardii]